MQQHWRDYLIQALKSDLAAKEAEILAIRSSLRYRVGGWVVEAWPPSRRTLVIAARIVLAFVRMGRGRQFNGQAVVGTSSYSLEAVEQARVLVFGCAVPSQLRDERTACINNALALAQYLDANKQARTLVVRRADQLLARRVVRLRSHGWKIIWWPEENSASELEPEVVYLMAHADEVMIGAGQ